MGSYEEFLQLTAREVTARVQTTRTRGRTPKKTRGTIRISYSHYSTDTEHAKKGDRYISVDFTGHNEGSGSPCDTKQEADKQIAYLKAKHGSTYDLKVIDERPLIKWRDFIVNLCKERGQEIEKIWFDTSVPYDNEIEVRLAGHRCWNSCVGFRFQEGKLKAYDSHFGGGTSMIHDTTADNYEETEIRKVMERVFNKDCSNSMWEDGHDKREVKKRVIEIDCNGWIKK